MKRVVIGGIYGVKTERSPHVASHGLHLVTRGRQRCRIACCCRRCCNAYVTPATVLLPFRGPQRSRMRTTARAAQQA